MEKTAIGNRAIYTLIWYTFYDLRLFLQPRSPHGALVLGVEVLRHRQQ